MARTITLDNLRLTNFTVDVDPSGSLRVHANYEVRSGSQVVRVVSREVTSDVPSLTSVNALAQALAGRLETLEL